MPLHSPPHYRYSLFKPWDRRAFKLLKRIGQRRTLLPRLIGEAKTRDEFLTALIRTQKSLHGWREFLKATLRQVEKTGEVKMSELVKQYPPDSIRKGQAVWATYKEDQIVSDFIDRLGNKKVHFIGGSQLASEFTMRFILGQLGHDWEQTIFMICELLGKGRKLSLSRLNKEMKKFDYAEVFKF